MRWIGFFMFIAGGALIYICLVLPLLEASHREDDISISMKGVMFAPALIVFGSILFFFGNDRAGQIIGGRPQGLTALGWVVTLATLAIGILLYEWLGSRLRAYGYDI